MLIKNYYAHFKHLQIFLFQAPMPFYAGDPNRFPTAWQTDPSQGTCQCLLFIKMLLESKLKFAEF